MLDAGEDDGGVSGLLGCHGATLGEAVPSEEHRLFRLGERVGRIKELDGLRAIAILLVLGCHYQGFARLLGGLPEFGWVGVDIFFVLSGYLITTILLGLRNQPTPYRTFYSRRAIRIFPTYFLLMAVVTAIAILQHDSVFYSPRYLVKQIFFLQAYSPASVNFLHLFFRHLGWYLLHPPNLLAGAHALAHGSVGLTPSLLGPSETFWSLSVEEYFYLLWAPIVLRCSRRTIFWTGVLVCIVEAMLRFYYAAGGSYFSLFFRFDSLIYGAFLALLVERWKRSGVPSWAPRMLMALVAGSLMLLWGMLFCLRPVIGREIRDSPLILTFGLPVMCLGTAALLGLLIHRANTGWWLARFLRTGIMQFIGTISYTMYLTHALVAFFVLGAFTRLAHVPAGHQLLTQALVSTVLTLGVARLSWHWVEKPLLRWKDRRFPGVRVAEPKLN